jgi:Ran-binding protein 3
VLGATKSDDEESDHESDAEADDNFVAEKTDERFHEKTGMDPRTPYPPVPQPQLKAHSSEPPVETGEENETTKFSAKGKLYYFDAKKWKERGAGTFKVNTQTDSDGNISGRMIMRADGALRVMLNSALFHGMNYGDTKGNKPITKDIYLASNEDGKIGNLLLRVSLLSISLFLVMILICVHSSAMKISLMSSTTF